MDRMDRYIALSDLATLSDVGYGDDMRALNKEHIEHIVASNLEGFPPIDVTPRNQKFIILNGYHRVEAARKLDLLSIEANVHDFSDDITMRDFVYSSNLVNGLSLSRKEKEAYVAFLSIEYPHLSQSQIADKVKLDQSSVSKILKRLGMNDPTMSSEDKRYGYPNREYAKKLHKALADFYENEKATFRGTHTPKSEEKRAKLLARFIVHEEDVTMFESLARTIPLAVKESDKI